MAQRIVRDSHLAIFVETVPVAEGTKGDDFVHVGAVRGLAGYDAVAGEDGNFYTNVDTAAEIRVSGVSGEFTVGQSVYVDSDGKFTSAATDGDDPNALVGRAVGAKAAAAGDLHIQLIPQAA